MNMFARFDEIPGMTLQDIKETKRYGWKDNVKTVGWVGGGGGVQIFWKCYDVHNNIAYIMTKF